MVRIEPQHQQQHHQQEENGQGASVGEVAGVGPVMRKLYERIRRIQVGEEADKFNWLVEV